MTFEWDETRNQENIEKHNISFEVAQGAFFDKKHSKNEDRFFV
jgi:uncharacterized DUF497 family protein